MGPEDFKEIVAKQGKSVVDSQKDLMNDEAEDTGPDPTIELINKMVNTLTDTNNIDIRTEFTKREILILQQAETLADIFDLKVLKGFILGIKTKKLSLDRGLRKELVQAILQIQPSMSVPDSGITELMKNH